ncbi:MAG: cytochrome c maturation protein CcmE [Pseudomonadota bacterium]
MTRKQRRGFVIGGGVLLLAVSVTLIAFAMRDTLVFFYAPSDIAEKGVKPGQRIRLGGLVADGSIKRGDGARVEFVVTDTINSIPVVYTGILPDLFREGQGVVTEGRLDGTGKFTADSVLAKHDENYMPAEVADALKERGVKLGPGATHKDGGS